MPERPDIACALYGHMARIRLFEEEIAARYRQQRMPTPVHLCLGQEAAPAGVCLALEPGDQIFTTHRSHGHYLAKGGDMARLAAELYARAWGCSHGQGGSMHVCDPEAGVGGATAIVGGSIPLGVGAALGAYVRGEFQVSVSFFGDGATDEGVMHESLNLAALKKLPVVFVCENNLYATCSHRAKRQAYAQVADLGAPYGVPGVTVDGNDAWAVFRLAKQAVARARAGDGPTLIEAMTYRLRGHVGPECDAGVGYRGKAEIDAWQARCPLARLRAAHPELAPAFDEADRQAAAEVQAAFEAAENDQPPHPASGPGATGLSPAVTASQAAPGVAAATPPIKNPTIAAKAATPTENATASAKATRPAETIVGPGATQHGAHTPPNQEES